MDHQNEFNSSVVQQSSDADNITSPIPKTNLSINQAKKSFNNLAVISFAIFILFAIGLVAFFYNQNQQLKRMLSQNALPSPSPTSTPSDPFANWITYTDQINNYSFKYPKEWQQIPLPPVADNIPLVAFQSVDGLYKLTTEIQPNINTNKPYATLDEFIGLPYTVKSLTIDGVDARQPLPRSGSENIYKVYFFSADRKSILNLELLVGDGTVTDHRVTGESLQIGEDIFNKVVSTFKFIATPSASPVASATCIPRPRCLDENPRCMIAETSNMCPRASASPTP